MKKDRLVSEDDQEFTEAQLRGYFWIMQLAWRLAYDSKDVNVIGEFEKLLRA